MKPGDRIDIHVRDLDSDGIGITEVNGQVIRIAATAPGDHIQARISHISRHTGVATATLLRVLDPGRNRQPHPCPRACGVAPGCGGCALGHLSADGQNQFKRRRLETTLREGGIFCSVAFEPSTAERTGYRNRSNFVPFRNRAGVVCPGSRKPGSHRPADMTGCRIVRNPIAKTATAICDAVSADIPLHPRMDGLRYVTLRAAVNERVLVDLIIGEPHPKWLMSLADRIQTIPNVAGISITPNTTTGNAIRTSAAIPIWGVQTIEETCSDLKLELSASTFFQLNTDTAARMYEHAADMVQPNGMIWDLYCGVGGLGLTVARRHGAKLHGLDSVLEVITIANQNAVRNQLDASFSVLDLERCAPPTPKMPITVLVNPPRRGLAPPVIEWLDPIPQGQLIYMSCNPDSFVRDAIALRDSGWMPVSVAGFDMLPLTPHLELLAHFQKE